LDLSVLPCFAKLSSNHTFHLCRAAFYEKARQHDLHGARLAASGARACCRRRRQRRRRARPRAPGTASRRPSPSAPPPRPPRRGAAAPALGRPAAARARPASTHMSQQAPWGHGRPKHVVTHGATVDSRHVAALANEPATKMQCSHAAPTTVRNKVQPPRQTAALRGIQQPTCDADLSTQEQAGAGRPQRQRGAPSSRRPWARRSRRAPSPAGAPAGSRARSGCCAAARRPPSPSGAPPSGTSCVRGGDACRARGHVFTVLSPPLIAQLDSLST